MPSTRQTEPVEVPVRSFEDAAIAVVDELRQALAGLIAALPEPAPRAVDIERQLDVDKKLAWRIFRLTRSSGLGEAANVPGRPAVRRLMAAAKDLGATDGLIHRIADASERFERFAQAHGGSREEAISLMVRLAGEASDPYELKTRKSYFRSAAHLWGVQAQLQVRTMIHQWTSPESGCRGVLVAGDINLQRRDPTRPLIVSARLQAESGEREAPAPAAANGAGVGGPELLTEYCSQPLPDMAPRTRSEGSVETELVFPVSGRDGALTLYTSRSVQASEEMHDTVSAQMFMAMPVEEVICDLVLEAGWTDPVSARVSVYGCRHRPEHASEFRAADLFPQRETVTYLGAMENIPPIAGAPRHQDAVRDVLERYGWSGRRFDVYRCRVLYPVLHTRLAIHVDPRRAGRT